MSIDVIVTIFVVILVLLILALALIWKFGESRWDLRSFRDTNKCHYENLHARKALYVVEHVDGLTPVDVRSHEQFRKHHLPGAISAPYDDGSLENSDLDHLARETPILVYCEGGYHSRRAMKVLKEMGFKTIYNLHRGFASWQFYGGETESHLHAA